MVADAWGFDRLAEVWSGWMLRMAWQVAALVAVVWILTLLLRRSNATLRYALWLLVFVKLVVPPVLGAPWSVGTVARDAWPTAVRWAADETLVFDDGAIAVGDAPTLPATKHPQSHPKTSLGVPQVSGLGVAQVSRLEMARVSRLGMTQVLMLIWAVGALGLLTVMMWQWRWQERRLLRDAETAPEEVLVWGRALAARLGLRQPVDLRVSAKLRVPCVVGFRKAVVLLPRDVLERLSPGQQADLIAHEMAHIKRRDLQTGWLVSILVCIYWFHPAVWLANFYLRREREMACDDKVLYTTRREGTKYASTMVRVAEGFDGGVPVGAGFLGLFEIADNLLLRVRSVADETRSRRAGWRSVMMVAFVALALMPMGVWTTASYAQAPEAAPKTETAPVSASAIDREIEQYYAKADPEVKEYIKRTANRFGRKQMWLPEGALDSLTPEQREEKVKYLVDAFKGEYGRHLCTSLAEAGVINDKRVLPGLMKMAGYHREGGNYDCWPKWIAVPSVGLMKMAGYHLEEGNYDCRAKGIAVASLGRQDDPSVAPLLVDLVDHGDRDVKMWAQASMSRLTGQNFGTDKKAWAEWWNANGKEPKIDVAQLKPWQPVVLKAGTPELQELINKAENLYREKKYDEAITCYKEIHDKYPQSNHAEDALMMVGVCLDWKGQKDEAIKAYEQAIKEYPELTGFSEATYFYLGISYHEVGRKEDAVKALQKCVEMCKRKRGLDSFPGADAVEALSDLSTREAPQS